MCLYDTDPDISQKVARVCKKQIIILTVDQVVFLNCRSWMKEGNILSGFRSFIDNGILRNVELAAGRLYYVPI